MLLVALAPSIGLVNSIQHETLRLWQKPQGANETLPIGSLGENKEHTVKLQRSDVETALTGHEKKEAEAP